MTIHFTPHISNPHLANSLATTSLLGTVAVDHLQAVLGSAAAGISIISGSLAILMYIRNYLKDNNRDKNGS